MLGQLASARALAAVVIASSALEPSVAASQGSAPAVPLVAGLTLVQTLHVGDVDRESVVTLADVSTTGVRYEWSYVEAGTNGDTVRGKEGRFVARADLDTAPRWHQVYARGEPLEHPGYTAFSLSRAVYDQLRGAGTTSSFSMLGLSESAPALGFFGGRPAVVRWRGTLTRVGSGPEPFPILLDGVRVQVPAVHLAGNFSARGESWSPQIWVLAHRDHPLVLKLEDAKRVFQTVRADIGRRAPAAAVESALARSCRVELPGIYFETNSATLDPASDATIASVAAMLARHRDWTITVEGHTDSIGTRASNLALSDRRASAVRDRLARLGVARSRLRAAGIGRERPRESNTTIAGRARNRRVELLRQC